LIQFRRKALARHQQADRFDELMRIAGPGAWLGVAALACVVVTLLVWGFAGNLPQTVSGQGVMGHEGGVRHIETAVRGEVLRVFVDREQRVRRGAPLVALVDESGKRRIIRARISGEVIEAEAFAGELVSPGDPLMSLDTTRSKDLVTFLFLDPVQATAVFPGMEVSLGTINYGNFPGVVREVDNAPATSAEMRRLVENDLLIEQLTAGGPPVVVRVEVEGAVDPRLSTGSVVDATVTLRDRRPVDAVFG
jgi:multidrug resistance efflux pump